MAVPCLIVKILVWGTSDIRLGSGKNPMFFYVSNTGHLVALSGNYIKHKANSIIMCE